MHSSHPFSSSEIQQDDEAQMIAAAKADPQGFAKLYDRYAPNIYRYLLSRLGNVAEAQDITSQTFLLAFEMFPRYRHTDYFSAWLFTIARNRYVDCLRRNKNRPEPLPEGLGDPQEGLLQQVIRSERCSALRQRIRGLPEEEQEILRLRFVANLSFAEMASILKRKEDAVKKTVYRLLARLKYQMEDEYGTSA
jgi:RNA polymerase sigma-70 factor (ECF subfamily)